MECSRCLQLLPYHSTCTAIYRRGLTPFFEPQFSNQFPYLPRNPPIIIVCVAKSLFGKLRRPFVFWRKNDMPSGRPWPGLRYILKVLEIEGIDSLDYLSSIACLGAFMILALESTYQSLSPRNQRSVQHRTVDMSFVVGRAARNILSG